MSAVSQSVWPAICLYSMTYHHIYSSSVKMRGAHGPSPRQHAQQSVHGAPPQTGTQLRRTRSDDEELISILM